MDKIKKYTKVIESFLLQERKGTRPKGINYHYIVDKKKSEYLLLHTGWYGKKFLHLVVYHFELKDDKIYIHKIGSDVDVVDFLVENDVVKKDIILNFTPPALRELSAAA